MDPLPFGTGDLLKGVAFARGPLLLLKTISTPFFGNPNSGSPLKTKVLLRLLSPLEARLGDCQLLINRRKELLDLRLAVVIGGRVATIPEKPKTTEDLTSASLPYVKEPLAFGLPLAGFALCDFNFDRHGMASSMANSQRTARLTEEMKLPFISDSYEDLSSRMKGSGQYEYHWCMTNAACAYTN